MVNDRHVLDSGAMGSGRQGTTRAKARQRGDEATFERLLPPSERRLTEDERCGARTAKTGDPCKARKGMGTDHPGYGNCVKHGGNTEAGLKKAMREMGSDIADGYKASIERFGGDRTDPSIATLTPEQALLEEVRRSAAFVRFLEERIAKWNLDTLQSATIEAFVSRTTNVKASDASMRKEVEKVLSSLSTTADLPALTSVDSRTGISSTTDAREWLYLYREERGHLARVSKMAIDAGVAQRLVAIAEDQGRILASAIRAVLAALSLTPEQAALVPQIVPPVLRAVATDSPIPDITSLTRQIT